MSGLRGRARDVRSVLTEHHDGPYTAERTGLFCNGCGKLVSAETVDELERLTIDWQIGDALGDSDYCPDCKEAQ